MATTLKRQLTFSIGITLVGLLVSTTLSGLYMTRLGISQDAGAAVAAQSALAARVGGSGAKLYQVIADTFLNRNLQEAAKDWTRLRDEVGKELESLNATAAEPREAALGEQGLKALAALNTHYETKILPLMRVKKAGDFGPDLIALDGEADLLVKNLQEPMSELATLKRAANKAEDARFDELRAQAQLISVLVQQAQGAVAQGQDTAVRAVASMEAIRDFIGGFSGMMREISAATEEQAKTSVEVARQVEESAHQTAQNASDVDQVAMTVTEIAHTADDLSGVADKLTAMVGQFRT